MRLSWKGQKSTWLYALSFLALTAVLLWKCRFGYANMDEAFYLTIPYRLCAGDCLLIHEWHLSQLSGFLLYPAMKLYLAVFGNTEGILLRFRVLFTLLWACSALFLYDRLKRLSRPGAMAASLAFLIFTPFGLMALSYNSMGLLLLLNACAIAATGEPGRWIPFGLAGLFFAGAVLCCPYLLLLYGLFTAAVIVSAARKKRALLRCWIPFSGGCAVLLAAFCLFLFSRGSLSQVIRVLPRLFEDPEHVRVGLGASTIGYLRCIVGCSRLFPICLVAAAGICWLSKRRGRAGAGLIAMCLVCLAAQIGFLLRGPYLNFVMFPLCLLAPYCALHSDKAEVRLPFFVLWLPGAVYTYCIYLSSNQEFYAVSSAATVMTVASLVILGSFVGELEQDGGKRRTFAAARAAAALLVVVQLCAEVSLRYTTVFWEPEGMSAQTVLAETGPEKGILMSPERHEHSLQMERDAERIRADDSVEKLLFLSTNTCWYLSAEKEMATFSAWLSDVNEISIHRLDLYFALFPEKIPDGIYIEPAYRQFAEHYTAQGYRAEEWGSGALWLTKGEPRRDG